MKSFILTLMIWRLNLLIVLREFFYFTMIFCVAASLVVGMYGVIRMLAPHDNKQCDCTGNAYEQAVHKVP